MADLQNGVPPEWRTGIDIARYQSAINIALANVNIPACLVDCSQPCNNNHLAAIDDYYSAIMTFIRMCTDDCLPLLKSNKKNKYNVPVWSDLV